MRLFTLVGFALVATGVYAHATNAQTVRSPTRGITVGAGLVGSAVSTNVGEETATESGGGVNLEFGYGFSPKWTGLLGLYSSAIDADLDYRISQVDLGVRYLFRDTDKQARPYLEGALSGRQFRLDVGDGTSAVTIRANSSGIALGGGVQIFFTPKVALDLGLSYAFGSFSDWEANGVSFPFREIDATSTNVRVGVRFWPQAN